MTDEEAFAAAIALPISQRDAFIEQFCGGDKQRLAHIKSLVSAHEATDSLLFNDNVDSTLHVEASWIGQSIGPYKLREQIGEGGMGTVFVAEQAKPVRRKVALKIIKAGMDTKDVVARFEAERQALALMNHPNIARVLDAGSTESGRPYFVMERVSGEPITNYCDDNKLTIRERLELFVKVCQAIQHAHQKGIIHRDIKPSNVLVTEHDGSPVPKVIDFGVAKAIGQKLTDRTVYTSHMQPVGTLQYMSPEQSRLSGLDIDTRSDVYALGLLLYELLTGLLPFDRETFAIADFDEKRRIIFEDEAPRPSTRVSTAAKIDSTAAEQRKVNAVILSKQLKGELDWIVAKALEKDRNRRHDSADRLAEDVQNYLDGEIVGARPPTFRYRLQKTWRKHRVFLNTGAAIIAVMSVALCVIVLLFFRQMDTQRRLERIADTYLRSLIEEAITWALKGDRKRAGLKVEELERILPDLDVDYQADTMRYTIDGVYHFYRGDMDAARALLQRSFELDEDNVIARSVFARSLLNTGDWPQFLEEVAKIHLPKNAHFHERLYFAHANLVVNNETARSILAQLVKEDAGNAHAKATFVSALVTRGVEIGDSTLVEQAMDHAEEAYEIDAANPFVVLVRVESLFGGRKLFDRQRQNELVAKAEPYIEELAKFPNYAPGQLSIAAFYERTGRHDQAREYWKRANFPDFQAAVFCKNGDVEMLADIRRSWSWSGSEAGRLNRLLVDIWSSRRNQVLQNYMQDFFGNDSASFGGRIAALQIALRLHDFETAVAEAKKLDTKFEELDDSETSHLAMPVKFLCADPTERRQYYKGEINSGSETRKLLANYWYGHILLAEGKRLDSIKCFREAADTVQDGFSYAFWADCLCQKLTEQEEAKKDETLSDDERTKRTP